MAWQWYCHWMCKHSFQHDDKFSMKFFVGPSLTMTKSSNIFITSHLCAEPIPQNLMRNPQQCRKSFHVIPPSWCDLWCLHHSWWISACKQVVINEPICIIVSHGWLCQLEWIFSANRETHLYLHIYYHCSHLLYAFSLMYIVLCLTHEYNWVFFFFKV